MKELMAELAPYVISGLFALIAWYIRDNQKQHADLVSGINGGIEKLSKTIIGLENRFEEQMTMHSQRFQKYTVSMERRMTEVETRCAFEHGDIPDRRQPRQHPIIDWQQASDVGGVNKAVKAGQ